MDSESRKRLRPILVNAKWGRGNTRADEAFMKQCWRKWPDEYSALHKEVSGEAMAMMNPLANGHG